MTYTQMVLKIMLMNNCLRTSDGHLDEEGIEGICKYCLQYTIRKPGAQACLFLSASVLHAKPQPRRN